ncbi:hypothetical protein KKG45_11650 [bacterium]|nr:hypothetical protein [bacterium]MBU1073890.1 hypothetical protein [bacterium]MBU1676651.1 hypothetical protein [bacterium]
MKFMLTILVLAAACGAAQAGVQWSWSNAGTGTELGTFITDGELVSDQAPAGTYTVVDFSVTASAYDIPIGSMSGGDYFTNQPEIGFDWDGSVPTVFWRLSGFYTNGFGLFVTAPAPGGPDYVGFGVDWFLIEYDEDVTFLAEGLTPILTPVGTVTASASAAFGALKALYR